jgi:hypothetical protein
VRVDQLGGLVQRWRYLVVAVEVMVAGGCLFFGMKVLSPPSSRPPIQVLRGPAGTPEAGIGVGLPLGSPATARMPSPPATPRVLSLTSDTLSRLNHDDFELYRRQWQVLQMLMNGVRTYLEQRVVPQLLSR